MNTDEVKNVVSRVVREVAEQEAVAALKTVGSAEINDLVNQVVDERIKELEADSATTSSWWVKVRNRFIIAFMHVSVAGIVSEVQQKIAQL